MEKQIEKFLKNEIKEKGGECFKFVSPGNSGVPDRIAILPGGHIYFIELKSEGKKPRPLQLKTLERLKHLGCEVYVFDNKEDINKWIEALK